MHDKEVKFRECSKQGNVAISGREEKTEIERKGEKKKKKKVTSHIPADENGVKEDICLVRLSNLYGLPHAWSLPRAF